MERKQEGPSLRPLRWGGRRKEGSAEGRKEGGRGRHDTARVAQRVPQRQADRGGAGDLPRRPRHGAGLPARDPAQQAGERAAPQAARRGRGAAAAAAVSR